MNPSHKFRITYKNNSQVLLLNASDEYSKLGDSDILNRADNYGN